MGQREINDMMELNFNLGCKAPLDIPILPLTSHNLGYTRKMTEQKNMDTTLIMERRYKEG